MYPFRPSLWRTKLELNSFLQTTRITTTNSFVTKRSINGVCCMLVKVLSFISVGNERQTNVLYIFHSNKMIKRKEKGCLGENWYIGYIYIGFQFIYLFSFAVFDSQFCEKSKRDTIRYWHCYRSALKCLRSWTKISISTNGRVKIDKMNSNCKSEIGS